MLYIDYTWDLEPNRIKFDTELNIDKLGWKNGDYFQVTNVNGQAQLIKVDAIEKFLLDGAQQKMVPLINEQDDLVRFVSQEQHATQVMHILRSKQ